eukprot:2545973-Amphidinium_carterae.1
MSKYHSSEFWAGVVLAKSDVGFTLPLLQSTSNILEQYPLKCPYRRKLMRGGWASKYMLLKVCTCKRLVQKGP